ncbi:Outer membrane protein transport protein (OMPP1/FadL/TodX) [Pseudogemmobacter humi]|uniref:Outer membrane protein transport protein (OMPP1/FadL/TodX) n=2 Tax=Pseudogemmobacter humi TaxID=2483812 RepID=A0A3P5XBA5_9RHOB|nr:Outer membrane protein transport protein (OMPP1/FadL/TodX) [Pseudogemmobacter humi]
MTSAAIAALTAGVAQAGGIDRSGQPIGVLFEEGNYFELGFGQIRPDVGGTYFSTGQPTGNVLGNYSLPSLALKYQFNEQLSGMISYDHAYGADVAYGGSFAAFQPLAGTTAEVKSDNFTALLRYKFNENWSVHGGIRASKAGGDVTIWNMGLTTAVPIYNAHLESAWGAGYVLGGAYERPDIALRAAVTYFSDVDHSMPTTESGPVTGMVPPGNLNQDTEVTTPQAVNIDLQTGIAKDTLAFFQFRWADWSEFRIAPGGAAPWLPQGLVDFEDSYTYTLGVGRRFNENWSGSVFITYEDAGDDRTTALSPYSGYRGIGLGVVYTQDNIKVTAGVRYMDLGNAIASSAGTPVGLFEDNHAVAAQIKVGYRF